MLSYNNLFKNFDEAVYNRGVRLYLDGAVGTPKKMLLDNWRQYRVIGGAQDSYNVKIPLLHLTMSITKLEQAQDAFLEVASCECVFFSQYGYCKHLVAVCSSLDKEFAFQKNNISVEGDILDNIFNSQKVKQHRKWLEVIDTLLSRDTGNYFYLDKISQALKMEQGEHGDFLTELDKIIEPIIGNYSGEKRLVRIMQEAILVGGVVWYDFWEKYFLMLDNYNQEKLFLGLWKVYWVTAESDYRKKLLAIFLKPSPAVKISVLEKLQSEFFQDKNIWLEYCFAAQYFEWFLENMQYLDPLTLIRFAQIYPEKREEVDILILNQIKIWSDYLPTGEYKMVVEVFKKWAKNLGKSDFYMEALKYFQEQHPRKKKLLNQLD